MEVCREIQAHFRTRKWYLATGSTLAIVCRSGNELLTVPGLEIESQVDGWSRQLTGTRLHPTTK